MAKGMNKVLYIQRTIVLSYSRSICENVSKKWQGLVYNLRIITNIKWLLRLSKAILNLSV